MAVSTNTLLNRLRGGKDFQHFAQENENNFQKCSLPFYLNQLCEVRSLLPSEVIRRAQIERTYGHQIFNGTRVPSRDKLIQIALGFGLSLEETQTLLRIAQRSMLYVKIERDAACMFGILHGMNVMEVQDLLESLNLCMLGEN